MAEVLFLACGLPPASEDQVKNLLTVAVLDHVHHLVAFRISCFRHYGLIRFADVGVAAALLDKTGGTLWVGGLLCHLVTVSSPGDTPLPLSSGAYVQDALEPALSVDLAHASFFDAALGLFFCAISERSFEQSGDALVVRTEPLSAPSTTPPPQLQPLSPPQQLVPFFVASHKRSAATADLWTRPLNHPTDRGYYVSKTDGKPACGPCRLKFATLEHLRTHEAESLTHLERLAPWVDRAKLRRLTAGPGEVVVTSKDALETPLDLREANNPGVRMMQKMGWTHGDALGALKRPPM